MEIGDKIVAIDDYILSKYNVLLTKGNIYTVKKIYNIQTYNDFFEQISVDEINEWVFETKYFITLLQYRKEKILKIKNKINHGRKKL